MKLLRLFCAIVIALSALPVGADELPIEVRDMLNDLGTPDVQQKNNNIMLKCAFGGTKKITVSLLDGATIFRGEYYNCKDRGTDRDGLFEFIVRDGKIIGQSAKRSINGELFEVAKDGNIAKAKKLIQKKADVNYSESISVTDGGLIDEWTPLMSAAARSDLAMVKLLVKSGAWVNYLNSRVVNALWLAANNGSLDIVKILINNGAYINNRNVDDITPLMSAAINGHLKVVKYLLRVKADMNLVHRDGDSALMLALAGGHTDIARLLIDSGAKINIQNKFGVSPLLIAVAENNEDMVRLLVEKKADLTVKSDTGKTAMDVAVAKGNENIIRLLK